MIGIVLDTEDTMMKKINKTLLCRTDMLAEGIDIHHVKA